jgi:hypothetical protein
MGSGFSCVNSLLIDFLGELFRPIAGGRNGFRVVPGSMHGSMLIPARREFPAFGLAFGRGGPTSYRFSLLLKGLPKIETARQKP